MNHAAATATPASLSAPRSSCQSVTKPTAEGATSWAHQRSARRTLVQRPAKSSATMPPSRTAIRRVRRDTASGLDAPPGEPSDDFAAGGVQRPRIGGLEPEHEDRLGVGGAEQPPAVRKGDADAVDGVHRIAGGEVRGGGLDDRELLGL